MQEKVSFQKCKVPSPRERAWLPGHLSIPAPDTNWGVCIRSREKCYCAKGAKEGYKVVQNGILLTGGKILGITVTLCGQCDQCHGAGCYGPERRHGLLFAEDRQGTFWGLLVFVDLSRLPLGNTRSGRTTGIRRQAMV